MGRSRSKKQTCKLCMKTPQQRNQITKVDTLPKTFTIMLEEMSGVKFSKADSLDMVVCLECLNFLKNMDSDMSKSKKNKITAEGKKRVFKLMEKKRIPAAQAIEIVLAEQKAKALLAQSGFKAPNQEVNTSQLVPLVEAVVGAAVNQPRIRLSGSQRKKATILMDAGMDPTAARQLVIAASAANAATSGGAPLQGIPNLMNLQLNNLMSNAPVQRGAVGQRGGQMQNNARGRNNAAAPGAVKGSLPQNTAGQKKPQTTKGGGAPQKGAAGQQKPNAQKGAAVSAPKAPVQRVAPVKGAPAKAGPTTKGSGNNQKVSAAVQKTTASPGILIQPNNKRQNSNPAGGRSLTSDKRLGAFVAPRRNERPVPYTNNRQQQNQNQSQAQSQQQIQQDQITSIDVGIVPFNYPNVVLDDMKLDALKEAITNEIMKIPQGGPLVRFLGTSAQDGWLKLVCADELSHNWLAMLVSRWERAGVHLVEGDALPNPVLLSFYLQGDFRSPAEILNIIEKQNDSLNVNQWRVMDRESDGQGQLITVCVDGQCFKALQSRDFMVFLGLGVVEMKPRRSNNSNANGGSYNNSSSQNSNNMQGGGGNAGRSGSGRGGNGGVGNNNYQSNATRLMDLNFDSGRGGGGGNGGNNNYNNQNYQRGGGGGGGYRNQRAW